MTKKSSFPKPLGPLMIDIEGHALTDLDCTRLADSRVGGLILFARNYVSPAQLAALCAEVHALRSPPLLIAIDQEGGRVQRCREGFTKLPAMRQLGALWAKDEERAKKAAFHIGFVLAAELRLCGVDMSFAPVLDLDFDASPAIGDRAFSSDPKTAIALADALTKGLHKAGMASCGKHFPGHGFVNADSHHETPVDPRDFETLWQQDILPYRHLSLDAIMPAHIVFPKIDHRTACFSPVWHQILREKLGFTGLVFSDDLSMQGASVEATPTARVIAAYEAGCDLLLLCNHPEAVTEVLENWQPTIRDAASQKIAALLPTSDIPPAVTEEKDFLLGIRFAKELCQ